MKTLGTAIIAIGLCFAATSASAVTFKTNKPGLVVKNLTCGSSFSYPIGFPMRVAMNIVNRTEMKMRGEMILMIYDSDGDPVDLRYIQFDLPQSPGRRTKCL